MKMMKKRKMIGIITAVFMLLSVCGISIPEISYATDTIVSYPAVGGNLYFDKSTGMITHTDFDVTSVTIPKQIDNVNVLGVDTYAFNSGLLSEINVEAGHEVFVAEDGILFNKDKTELIKIPAAYMEKEYVIPDTVIKIWEDAIWYCDNLTTVTIPASVAELYDPAFGYCTNLTSIIVDESNPKFMSEDGESVI